MNKKEIGQVRELIREISENLTNFLAGLNKTEGKNLKENVNYFVNSLPENKEKKGKYLESVSSYSCDCYRNIKVVLQDMEQEDYDRAMDPYTKKLLDQVYFTAGYTEKLYYEFEKEGEPLGDVWFIPQV